MVTQNIVAQELLIEVRINFGSGNAFVSQHFLNSAQIGTAFHKVCSKGMAERVWAQVLFYSCPFCQVFDDVEHHLPGDGPAALTEKDHVFVMFSDVDPAAVMRYIQADELQGRTPDGDEPLLIAFSDHTDKPFLRMQIGELERHQFRHTQSATIQRFKHGHIAFALWLTAVYLSEHRVNLFYCEKNRQFAAKSRRFQEFGWVACNVIFNDQEFKKMPDASHNASLAGFCEVKFRQPFQKLLQVLQRNGCRL